MIIREAEPNTSRSSTILAYAGILAISMLMIWEVQTRRADQLFLTTGRSFAKVYIPSLNTTFYGRRLVSDAGDYFLDVGYASGESIFEVPTQAVINKNQTYYSLHYGFGCPNGYPRLDNFKNRLYIPETCHKLNIYRCKPKRPNALQSVLVYIGDGMWESRNDAANIHPQTAVNDVACFGEMIIVTVNYRTGVYGFFDKHHPTNNNFALNDIILALKWVKSNIGYFGGNPEAVTVLARGVGAQLVSRVERYQNNLLHRLVLLSGSGFAPTFSPNSKYNPSLRFAKASNCTSKPSANSTINYERIVDCLRNVKKAVIEAVGSNFTNSFVDWPIADEADTVIQRSEIPTILGVCRKRTAVPLSFTRVKLVNELRSKLLQVDDIRALNYSDVIIQHYVNAFEQSNDQSVDEFIKKIKHDFVVEGPFLIEALHRSIAAPVYYVEYEDLTSLTRWKIDTAIQADDEVQPFEMNQTNPAVVNICFDDLIFKPLKGIDFLMERKIASAFMNYLRNFVTSGNPNDIPSRHRKNNLPYWPKFADLRRNETYKNENDFIRMSTSHGAYVTKYYNKFVGGRSFWLCEIARKMPLTKDLCQYV